MAWNVIFHPAFEAALLPAIDCQGRQALREAPGGVRNEEGRVMASTLEDILGKLGPERQRRVKARTAQLAVEELTLRDLRKAHDLTQARMAELLHVGQDSVSRLEQRSDLLLSTLRDYIAAMGGTLELVVHFPDRPVVVLSGLRALAGKPDKTDADGHTGMVNSPDC